jgi:hypothetical protein
MAQRWNAPFDPTEVKDFIRDHSAEMAKSKDAIATVEFVLPSDAIAASLEVATSYQLNGVQAVVWFRATDPAAFDAAFAGKEIAVSHTITTTNARTLHETCILKVREK